MGLREDLQTVSDPKERSRLKAEHIRDLLRADYDRDGTISLTRQVGAQTWRLTLLQRPDVVRDRSGVIVGVDVRVKLERQNARGEWVVVPIDGHRRIVNPPVLVPDGGTETVTDPDTGEERQVATFAENPREAFVRALIDSVRDTPNLQG